MTGFITPFGEGIGDASLRVAAFGKDAANCRDGGHRLSLGRPGTYARPMALRHARGLALSCHPAPTLAVTTLTTVLFASAGNHWTVCVIGAAAVLTGQLSIGWSNDLIDADRDLASGRRDKPVALGEVPFGLLRGATGLASVATVPLSLGLGWRSGLLQLVVVACGWAYNLGAKSTRWSPLPFLIAFGALPGVATLARPGHALPPVWSVATAGLLGVAAHFSNVLPDLADDLATGVRGLPHRLGGRASAWIGAGAVSTATAVLLFGSATGPSPLDWAGFTVVIALAAIAIEVNRGRPRSDAAFYATIAAAAVNVTLMGIGHPLAT